jgi:acylphosphatase
MSAMEGEDSAGAQLHAIVHGDVQGVGFRYFVARNAGAAGLVGWVRNRSDGTVECLAEGDRAALRQLLEDLRRGPSGAQVDSVEESWDEPKHDMDRFRMIG